MVSSPVGVICASAAVTKSSAPSVGAMAPADLARHLFQGGQCDGAAPEGAEHVPGEQDWLDRGGPEGDLMELNGWSSPQMLRRYGASARSARARRTYDRIMDESP